MYLALLKEEEKNLFLELACSLSASDGDFETEETEMIVTYCKEMGVTYDNTPGKRNAETIINQINKISDSKSKKIIVFELVGLALCDDKYDIHEKNMIYDLAEKIAVGKSVVEEFEHIIADYIKLQSQMNNLILN